MKLFITGIAFLVMATFLVTTAPNHVKAQSCSNSGTVSNPGAIAISSSGCLASGASAVGGGNTQCTEFSCTGALALGSGTLAENTGQTPTSSSESIAVNPPQGPIQTATSNSAAGPNSFGDFTIQHSGTVSTAGAHNP